MNTPGPYEVLHIGAEPAYLGDGGHTRRIAERQRDLIDTLNRMNAQGYRFLETRGEFAIFRKRITGGKNPHRRRSPAQEDKPDAFECPRCGNGSDSMKTAIPPIVQRELGTGRDIYCPVCQWHWLDTNTKEPSTC
jgi:hypothetical protein